MLYKYVWGNIAQENYLCNIGMFLQETLQCCLGLLVPAMYTTITCTMQIMLAHSPQSSECCPDTAETTLHKKITGVMLAQTT